MPRRKGHIPVRTCVSCGEKRSKTDLIRLALDVKGEVVRDDAAGVPGRGAYVCPVKDCWENLDKGGRLSRAFRRRGPLRLRFDPNACDVSDNTIH
ncbi:MAG: YlxR family protein [Desulfatiglandaceae bacterium]